MPRQRRKTKPETRLRKVQVELHDVKSVVRWAIKELRHTHLHGQANGVADELARIIGESVPSDPPDIYDPAEDPNASPDAEHEMMVCSPVTYDKLLAQRERKARQ